MSTMTTAVMNDANNKTEHTKVDVLPQKAVLNGLSGNKFHFTVTSFQENLVGVMDPTEETKKFRTYTDVGELTMGGKTINLMEMQLTAQKYGYHVPGGFGIGCDAYDYYMKTGELPFGLIEMVKYFKKHLGGKIAIRSSGNVEDGTKASAAGVFESHYVTNDADIEKAIRNIYDTARSAGAIEYFNKIGVKPEEIRMGLTIQKLVDIPLAAGVTLSGNAKNGEHMVTNYVRNSFGNVIADGTNPGNELRTDATGNVIAHEVNTPKTTLKGINHSVKMLLESTMFDTIENIKKEFNSVKGDMEWAIDRNAFANFIQNTRNQEDIIRWFKVLDNTSGLKLDIETQAQELLNNLPTHLNTKELAKLKDTANFSARKDIVKRQAQWYTLLLQVKKAYNIIDDNDVIKQDFDKWLGSRGLVSLLQFRELVRDIPTYNPNATGSLSCIYMSPEKIQGMVVNIEEFTGPNGVHQAEEVIQSYKSMGYKVILVGSSPGIDHEHALKLSDAAILEKSGSGSHIALRAGERQKPSIGGCKIDSLHTGDLVTLDTQEMQVTNENNENILEALFAGGNINQQYINEHVARAEQYIYVDQGREKAVERIKQRIQSAVAPQDAEILYAVIDANKDRPAEEGETDYIEQGYDDSLSNRILAKIPAEVMSLGGLMYESELLGRPMDLAQAKEFLGSELIIDPNLSEQVKSMAKKYGVNQEFLYPGVTKSNDQTLSLEQMIKSTLIGKPKASVRSLTGVGGIRNDVALNRTVDCQKFLSLKAVNDRRYYPGIWMLYLLINDTDRTLPIRNKLQQTNPYLAQKLQETIDTVSQQEAVEVQNAALLCSVYLPEREEMDVEVKRFAQPKTANNLYVRLFQAYHSPRSELQDFHNILVQSLNGNNNIETHDIDKGIEELTRQLKAVKTFNSTIHIPWANGLANLSNGLIGQLKNSTGDTAMRYGIGFEDKSLEIVQYDFADGTTAYQAKIYDNKTFEGRPTQKWMLKQDDAMMQQIEEQGFLKTAIQILQNQ